jgi:hypothetical protein
LHLLLPPPAETLEPAIHSPEQKTNNTATHETILVFIDRISFHSVEMGESWFLSSSNGNAGGIHRGRPSHDLHIAVFPIDAMTGIRPGDDDRRHYTDPCSGWRAGRQTRCSP